MKNKIAALPWGLVIILCLTIGLAPYRPPHVAEKLALLFRGELTRPVDLLDFAMHGFPWVLLAAKALSGKEEKS